MKNTALILLLVSTFAGTDALASFDGGTDLHTAHTQDTTMFVQTVEKITRAPLHAGEGRTYNIAYKTAIKFARQATIESGLIIETSTQLDDATYMIVGKAKASAWSWG